MLSKYCLFVYVYCTEQCPCHRGSGGDGPHAEAGFLKRAQAMHRLLHCSIAVACEIVFICMYLGRGSV